MESSTDYTVSSEYTSGVDFGVLATNVPVQM